LSFAAKRNDAESYLEINMAAVVEVMGGPVRR
jgi:hypothetical protein